VSYELSIVVPTRNEVENIRPLLDGIAAALAGRSWEVLFVDDDSPDGTADLVDSIAAANPHVRCLRRVGRRGLSSACLEGFQATSALGPGVAWDFVHLLGRKRLAHRRQP